MIRKRFVICLLCAVVATGCSHVETISYSKLLKVSKSWKEPKVAIWYYVGSDDSYHYFHFIDLGISEKYRVKKSEIHFDTFPLTMDRGSWRVLPWGPRTEVEAPTSGSKQLIGKRIRSTLVAISLQVKSTVRQN